MPLAKTLSKPLGLVVFALSVALGFFVLVPTRVIEHGHLAISAGFVLTFALLMTFTVTSLKERVRSARQSANSTLGFLAMAIGITALQVCGMGATCGFSALTGIIALLIPGALFNFTSAYSLYIIAFSILLQIIALISMGAFRSAKKTA